MAAARTRPARCDTRRVNGEYVWWVLVLVLVGGCSIALLSLGRLPGVDDEEPRQSSPVNTTVPGPDEPPLTSETP